MFVLTVLSDKLRILPEQLDRDPGEVLVEQIELKYANKVLPDVGLCISFYDFMRVEEPYVYPAAGACHQIVTFRLVVFRPFAGEVITGKILSSSREGVRVTLGFFDDILIPHFLLQQPASFDSAKNTWFWNYDTEAAADGEGGAFSMDRGEEVRFKVRTLSFVTVTNTVKERRTSVQSETRPPQRGAAAGGVGGAGAGGGGAGGGGGGGGGGDAGLPEPGTRRRASSSVGLIEGRDAGFGSGAGSGGEPAAMQIVASVQEDGLGLASWWR